MFGIKPKILYLQDFYNVDPYFRGKELNYILTIFNPVYKSDLQGSLKIFQCLDRIMNDLTQILK